MDSSSASPPVGTPVTQQQPHRSPLQEEFNQFSQKLDLLLKPVAKRCRYALPVPSHLAHEEGVHNLEGLIVTKHSVAGGGGGSAAAPASPDGSHPVDALAVAKALSQAHCEGQLPNLNAWRARVRTARLGGEKCLADVQQLTTHVQAIRDVTVSVREQSDLLSSNASSLMVRKTRLERVQTVLQESIAQYTKVEDLAREAAHPMLSAASARFSVMLEEIEDVMQFLSNNASHKSSKPYALKLALSQQRALQCLKDALCTQVNASHNKVMGSAMYSGSFFDKNSAAMAKGFFVATPAAAAAAPPAGAASAATDAAQDAAPEETLEARGLRPALAVLNAALLRRLDNSAPLRRIAEARCTSLQDDIHLQDLLATYRDARCRLVCPLLRDHLLRAIRKIEAREDSATRLRSLTALCLAFARDVLDEERLLFEAVWLRDDLSVALSQLAVELSEEAYHIFRANLLGVDSLDALAFAADTINASLQLLPTTSEGGAAASASGDDNVATLARRMSQDVQERVIFRTSVYIRSAIASQSFSNDDCRKALLPPPPPPAAAAAAAGDSTTTTTSASPSPVMEPLPVLRNCEYLLSTLYPTVEKSVFAVFAEESIHLTLTQLSRFIKAAAETNAVPNCALQARLFHLRHLLRLRAHIARFDASLVVVEKTLDLSQLVQRKLEILQSSREVKRDIESEMKVVCEDIVQLMGDVVLSGLRKLLLTSSSSSSLSAAPPPASISAAAARQLSSDAVAALDAMHALLQRYIDSTATRSVLIRPVLAQLADLQAALQKAVVVVAAVAAPPQPSADAQQQEQQEAPAAAVAQPTPDSTAA